MEAYLPQTVEEFEDALARRVLIGQGCGILMERDGIDADEAFARLVKVSQLLNVKLVEIARGLVQTRELPVVPDKPPARTRPPAVPGHDPLLLTEGNLSVVECRCGWRSWGYSTKGRARAEHDRHVEAATTTGPSQPIA